MSQNTVPPSSKFTLKSKDSAKLPGGLTSVYRSFKEPKVRSWIKRRTRGLAAHPWSRHCRLKLKNQMARLPKKLAHNSCQKAPNLEINGKRGRFLKARQRDIRICSVDGNPGRAQLQIPGKQHSLPEATESNGPSPEVIGPQLLPKGTQS